MSYVRQRLAFPKTQEQETGKIAMNSGYAHIVADKVKDTIHKLGDIGDFFEARSDVIMPHIDWAKIRDWKTPKSGIRIDQRKDIQRYLIAQSQALSDAYDAAFTHQKDVARREHERAVRARQRDPNAPRPRGAVIYDLDTMPKTLKALYDKMKRVKNELAANGVKGVLASNAEYEHFFTRIDLFFDAAIYDLKKLS